MRSNVVLPMIPAPRNQCYLSTRGVRSAPKRLRKASSQERYRVHQGDHRTRFEIHDHVLVVMVVRRSPSRGKSPVSDDERQVLCTGQAFA